MRVEVSLSKHCWGPCDGELATCPGSTLRSPWDSWDWQQPLRPLEKGIKQLQTMTWHHGNMSQHNIALICPNSVHLESCLLVVWPTDLTTHSFRLFTSWHYDVISASFWSMQSDHSNISLSWVHTKVIRQRRLLAWSQLLFIDFHHTY